MIIAPLASLLLTSSPSLGVPHLQLPILVAQATEASPGADAVVLTRDGKRHVGKVLSETKEGYLFHEDSGATLVIPFADIVDMNGASAASQTNLAAPAPTPTASAGASTGASSAKRDELMLQLKHLQNERDDMQSGTWALSFMALGALDMILVNVLPCNSSADQCKSSWTTYMLFGAGCEVVGGAFGIYWLNASSDLDTQIAETKVKLDQEALMPRQRLTLHYAWRF